MKKWFDEEYEWEIEVIGFNKKESKEQMDKMMKEIDDVDVEKAKQDYINAIPRVQAFQRIKYPKLLEIEQRMRSEVSEFNRAIDSVYFGEQTKSK